MGVLVGVLTWAIQRYTKPFVAEKISEVLSPDAPDLYTVKIDDLLLVNGSTIFLNGLSIVPDTAMLAGLDSTMMPPQILWLNLVHFEVSLKSVVGALFGQSSLSFDGVLIQQAELKVRQIHQNDSATKPEDSETEIFINGLIAEDFKFSHQPTGDSAWSRSSVKRIEVSCRFTQRKINGESDFDLDEEYVEIDANQLQFTTADGLYKLGIEQLLAGTNPALRVVGFSCEPRYDKNSFQKHISFQSDRIEARIEEFSLFGLAWNGLLNQGSVDLDFLHIGSGELFAYRDRNTPFDESRRPSLPVRLVRELPVALSIDSLSIENLDIEYQERPENQKEVAVIPFKELSARLYNITNLQDEIAADSLLVVRGSTKLFGEPALSAEFRYNLNTINGQFWVGGELAAFDMTILNKTLEPLMGMSLDAGQHEHTSFSIRGNDFSATGKMEMQYHGLTAGTGDNKGIAHLAKDALAKSIVYHKENPKNGVMRLGVIGEERDPSKFVFNYWWILYKSGVKSSVIR